MKSIVTAETDFIDKLALIYLKDHKVLCTMTKGNDTWYFPGGKRKPGETDEEALIREVKEELAVDIDQPTIQPYGVFEAQAHGQPEGVMVRMTCYMAEVIGVMRPSSEIGRIAFFGYHDDIKKSPVDYIIFDDLHNKGLLV